MTPPAEGFEAYCLERLAEFASRNLQALVQTKGYLRSAIVQKIRDEDSRRVPEFLDLWFRPETQARMRGIVEKLASRG